MKFLHHALPVAVIALAVGMTVQPGTAHAAGLGGNAANFCQSALPVFDVQIRKRPLAVQNEGTTSAYVTCAFNTRGNSDSMVVFFNSRTGTPSTLSCTGVYGVDDGTAKYVVKDIPLEGNGEPFKMIWWANDFPGGKGGNGEFGISCNLAPGIGITSAWIDELE